MSTAAGLGSLTRAARAIPRHVALPVAIATAGSALLILAGASFGAGALFFCIPAAVAALLVVLRIEARQEGLRLIGQQDALTGLGNRRLLHERLNYEISRHRRHSRRFTVLALDLDGFKQVNDRYGHAAGDEILREVARSLEKAVREQDTVVRVGGDEFCVLAPEIGWEDAERLADRLELAVETAVGGLDMLGVSVGFAVFPDEGWTPEHLLSRADQAGMEEKRRTRARHLRVA
jgi:diguanylate cyclase (GGDEF)-like protein